MVQATKDRKKVLYVVTRSNYGGAQKYVYDIATNIQGEFEPVVVCGYAHGKSEAGFFAAKIKEANIRTIVVPHLRRDIGLTDILALFALWNIVRRESPDVLHLNSSKSGVLGACIGRMLGVPRIIFTAHGWAFRESRNILVKAIIWIASVVTILLSDAVICVSVYDRNTFAGWFFQKKLVVVHNALPPGRVLVERTHARKHLVPHAESHTRDVWVGSVSELTANKNILLALEAVARARRAGARIFYCIVGDGEERTLLEAHANELGIGNHTVFTGFVPDAARYVHAFDIFLMTSRKEGLPYALLEAEHAGIPIVASTEGGIPEIVRDGENGILCPLKDVERFSDALEELARDHEIRKKLSVKIDMGDRFEIMLRETFALYLFTSGSVDERRPLKPR